MNDIVPIYHAGSENHVFICMHGAGHSAMSFAKLAKCMKSQYTVVAFDFRGHGEHFCENELDMSEETLVRDSIEVIKHICEQYSDRSVIIVGHSMGGSVATKTTSRIYKDYATEEWTK